jgi:hypothetical protein
MKLPRCGSFFFGFFFSRFGAFLFPMFPSLPQTPSPRHVEFRIASNRSKGSRFRVFWPERIQWPGRCHITMNRAQP